MQWVLALAMFSTSSVEPSPWDFDSSPAWELSRRPPIIETSRESVEPPLLDPFAVAFQRVELSGNSGTLPAPTGKQSLQVGKTCLCSPLCTCGCNNGQPCQCGQPTTPASYPGIPDNSNQTGSGIPYREPANVVGPAPVRIVPMLAIPQPVFRPMQSFGNFAPTPAMGGGRNC